MVMTRPIFTMYARIVRKSSNNAICWKLNKVLNLFLTVNFPHERFHEFTVII